jgi:hypothetical protein
LLKPWQSIAQVPVSHVKLHVSWFWHEQREPQGFGPASGGPASITGGG